MIGQKEELEKNLIKLIFAQAFGYTLDMKVKVPYRQISTNNKVKIKDDLYDIYKKDEDYPNIYLYLQKVVLKDD